MEDGRWKVEGGRWKVEGGRWKVEGGRWKVDGPDIWREVLEHAVLYDSTEDEED